MIFIIASCVLHCCKLIWIYKFSFTGQFTKSIFCHTLKSSAHVFLLFQKKCVTLHSILKSVAQNPTMENPIVLPVWAASVSVPWAHPQGRVWCWTQHSRHRRHLGPMSWVPVPEGWEAPWLPYTVKGVLSPTLRVTGICSLSFRGFLFSESFDLESHCYSASRHVSCLL